MKLLFLTFEIARTRSIAINLLVIFKKSYLIQNFLLFYMQGTYIQISFSNRLQKLSGALQLFCNHWCKLERVESNNLKTWKLNIFIFF